MSSLSVSLYQQLKNTPLAKPLTSFGKWYMNQMGYRRVGLLYDDLLLEEVNTAQRALGRLTTRQAYDRSYRFKRAAQASISHKDLPKEQWTPVEQDTRYITPHLENIMKEEAERVKWDTIHVERR